MRVKWLRTALRELDAQATYIAQDDPDMAAKIYAHIRRRVAMLSNFPESGRPGRVFGTRELIIDGYPYIVPYRIRDGILEILQILAARLSQGEFTSPKAIISSAICSKIRRLAATQRKAF